MRHRGSQSRVCLVVRATALGLRSSQGARPQTPHWCAAHGARHRQREGPLLKGAGLLTAWSVVRVLQRFDLLSLVLHPGAEPRQHVRLLLRVLSSPRGDKTVLHKGDREQRCWSGCRWARAPQCCGGCLVVGHVVLPSGQILPSAHGPSNAAGLGAVAQAVGVRAGDSGVRDPCAKELATSVLAWHGLAVNVLVEGICDQTCAFRRLRTPVPVESGHCPGLKAVTRLGGGWCQWSGFGCQVARSTDRAT